jgi:L-2,4-diaminobutyric acid acetyltransferase
MSNVMETVSVRLRKPQPKDGASMWALVRDSRTLDLNSAYLYLLLSEHFANTCVIAENEQGIIGFVSAFTTVVPVPENLFFN